MPNEYYAVMLVVSVVGLLFIFIASGALAVGQWIDAVRYAQGKRYREMRWKIAEATFHTVVACVGFWSAVSAIVHFKWVVACWAGVQ